MSPKYHFFNFSYTKDEEESVDPGYIDSTRITDKPSEEAVETLLKDICELYGISLSSQEVTSVAHGISTELETRHNVSFFVDHDPLKGIYFRLDTRDGPLLLHMVYPKPIDSLITVDYKEKIMNVKNLGENIQYRILCREHLKLRQK